MATIELVDPAVADQAEQAADRAARLAGVVVHMLQDHQDVEAAERLFQEVWGDPDDSLMPPSMTKALIHAGNYVSGAVAHGNLIGASIGFLGWRDRALHLHSHVTGVVSSMQGRSVGYALKQHQRAWALKNGLQEIVWTFDPLVGRNGYFNVTKLGAEIVDYIPNFYGEMRDGLNRDTDSDRCVVVWRLGSQRAIDASEGRFAEDSIDPTAAVSLVAESPERRPIVTLTEGQQLAAFVPRDIIHLRKSDSARAHEWRTALRDGFTWAFSQGYRVTGMTRTGTYILARTS